MSDYEPRITRSAKQLEFPGVLDCPVVTTAQELTGKKFDSGKPRMSLIPRSALLEEAKVLTFGAGKYGPDNWRGGMEYRRLLDALLRHVTAFVDGEDLDPETGLSHLAHARCCAGFLIEYQTKKLGKDDRPK